MILRSGATLPKGVWPGSRDATGEPLFFVLLRCALLHSVNQDEEHHYCENAGNDPDEGNVVHFFTSGKRTAIVTQRFGPDLACSFADVLKSRERLITLHFLPP